MRRFAKAAGKGLSPDQRLMQQAIGTVLHARYDSVIDDPIPDELLQILRGMDHKPPPRPVPNGGPDMGPDSSDNGSKPTVEE